MLYETVVSRSSHTADFTRRVPRIPQFLPMARKKAHKSQNAGYPRFSVGTAEGLLFVVVSVVLEAGCSMESDFLRFLRHHTNEASDI
jgi:hypothetical protein